MITVIGQKSRGLWFDSHSAGHVQKPWTSLQSTPPLANQLNPSETNIVLCGWLQLRAPLRDIDDSGRVRSNTCGVIDLKLVR